MRREVGFALPLDAEAITELTERCRRIGLLIGARGDIERLIEQSYTVLRSAIEHIKAFAAEHPDGFTRSDAYRHLHGEVTPERAWQLLNNLAHRDELRRDVAHTENVRVSRKDTTFYPEGSQP
mgnify:CR=1 FL=1